MDITSLLLEISRKYWLLRWDFLGRGFQICYLNFQGRLPWWPNFGFESQYCTKSVITTAICTLTSTLSYYTVSQKTVQNYFCQNFVKLPPILTIFHRKMSKRLKLCEMQSLSTSHRSNSHHHTTVLNADVRNCYTTLKVVISSKFLTT